MLESIGGISLIVLSIYFLLQYQSAKENKERNRKELIKYSFTAGNLTRKYAKSINAKNPIMTERKYNRTIDSILEDEKDAIRRRIAEEENQKLKYQTELRIKRKLGYRFENFIFSIFNDNRELDKQSIIEGICIEMNIRSIEESEELFKKWIENELISLCEWNKNKYEIGIILTSRMYKLHSEDIVWKEWREKNNITLKPISQEYKNYDDGLPF